MSSRYIIHSEKVITLAAKHTRRDDDAFRTQLLADVPRFGDDTLVFQLEAEDPAVRAAVRRELARRDAWRCIEAAVHRACDKQKAEQGRGKAQGRKKARWHVVLVRGGLDAELRAEFPSATFVDVLSRGDAWKPEPIEEPRTLFETLMSCLYAA
ncbi:MAG: hypothetical protein ABEI52_11935, partial [Halobacteriaceae archaeon]